METNTTILLNGLAIPHVFEPMTTTKDLLRFLRKLAIIDIDGVIADNSERADRAKRIADIRLEEDRVAGMLAKKSEKKIKQRWQGHFFAKDNFFDPEEVLRDKLIEGAAEAIEKIYYAGYQVFYVSGRPADLYAATERWMCHIPNHILLSDDYEDQLILRPASAVGITTAQWKATVIATLARVFRAEEIMVVDDDLKCRNAIHPQQFASAAIWTAPNLEAALWGMLK